MAKTCTKCKYYDTTNEKIISGEKYHPCKRYAPIVHQNSYDNIGTWPIIKPQTPICGEFKRKHGQN